MFFVLIIRSIIKHSFGKSYNPLLGGEYLVNMFIIHFIKRGLTKCYHLFAMLMMVHNFTTISMKNGNHVIVTREV